MPNQSYYDILGVNSTASKEEIKSAYRELSKMYHPDMNGGKSIHTKDYMLERFKRISAAHSTLSNDTERRKYDLDLSDFRLHSHYKGRTGSDHDFGYGNGRKRRTPNSTFYIRGLPVRPGLIFTGLCLGSVVIGFMKDDLKNGSTDETKMVQAWKDPQTGQWHAPAPWDPIYRTLKPDLELVPRCNVKPR